MSLAATTLGAACAQLDTQITVASAASVAAGRYIRVDGEVMQVTKGYVVASTTVPVSRGLNGSAQVAHLNTARVVHGTGADFGDAGAGIAAQFAPASRPRRIRSYRTTASMDLPAPGEDLVVRLDSSAFTLTVPVPTADLDGCEVTFISSAAAAYVLVFTGGLGGAGGGYTTLTMAAGGAMCIKVMAMGLLWNAVVAVPVASTVTNITATIS